MEYLHVSLTYWAQGYPIMGSHRKNIFKMGRRTKKFDKSWFRKQQVVVPSVKYPRLKHSTHHILVMRCNRLAVQL